MHPILSRNLYLVKEHVGFFKSACNFDVYDPSTGEVIIHCREPHLGTITKLLRFSDWRQFTPFDIHVTTPDGEPILRVTRGVNLFLSKVSVLDEDEDVMGGFKQKLFTIGGAFTVNGADGQPLCELQGSLTGWNFQFKHEGQVLAEVTKKWSGMGKELFTGADNYVVKISDSVPPDNPLRILILGAVFCIDMVLKRK
ncbi:LURP-one-related/scramblase family protein [Planctomicrobium sp. SH668]|uniref:LURP-one-related/scramblase family protein n=1 Tax=Planctomicrobium sp. SH668 TaxID=3448126 RepID=UPI003F5B9C05